MRLAEETGRAERHDRIAELASAFARRGPATADESDEIVDAMLRIEAALQPRMRRALETAPPPRISAAFVGAVLSETHLRGALADGERGDLPVVRPEILGHLHPSAPVEELLQRLDRRAARHLRQVRGLDWMWSRFGLDRSRPGRELFRLLFPGWGEGTERVELVRRGGQLYAVVARASRSMGTSSLFLPWTSDEPASSPLGSFRARAVDPGLRHALGRAIGADPAELDLLLESMVCLVPRERGAAFLDEDRWRASGRAALTGLGLPYTAASWLVRPPREEEITWRRWLEAHDGRIRPSVEPRMVFDGLAARRVEVMLRQIYTGLLAGLHRRACRGSADIALFDVQRHLAAVLQPLLAWPRDPAVHRRVATATGLPAARVTEALERVADRWSRQAERVWLAVPDHDQPYTVHGFLAEHLVGLHASLRQLGRRPADSRRDHRTALLLFAAHHLARAPIERLWLGGLSDMPVDGAPSVPAPEDVPGAWFWGCWARLIEAVEPQQARNAPPLPA